MRIPLGRFGQTVAQPAPSAKPQGGEFGQGMARAMDQIAQGAGDLARGYQQYQDANARAKAGNALLDHEIEVKTRSEDVINRVETGQIDYTQAREEFDRQLQELKPPQVDGLNPQHVEALNKGVSRLNFSQQQRIDATVENAKRRDFKSQFGVALDKINKLAGMPDADVDRLNQAVEQYAPLAQAAGLPADVISTAVQNAKDQNWTNHAVQRSIQAKDDLDALTTLEHDLTAGNGYYAEKLDTDKRNGILRAVVNDRLQLENRAAHAVQKREVAAERSINEMDRQIASTIPATAQQWREWAETVKGTPSEAEYKQRVADEKAVQAVLKLPVDQQMQFVQGKEAELMTKGGTVRDGANLNRLKLAVDRNVKQLSNDGLGYLETRTGQVFQPLDAEMLNSPEGTDTAARILGDRAASLDTLRKQYGPVVQRNLLKPIEQQFFTKMVNEVTPGQAAELFGSIRDAAGSDENYTSIMQQIAPDSPVRSLAGILYSKQQAVTLEHNWVRDDVKTDTGDIARTLLTGEAILNKTKGQKAEDGKPSNFPLPPEKQFRAAFEEYAGTVFAGRPRAYETAVQAVRAYYTGKAASDGDVSGMIDDTRMARAVTSVLGSVVDANGRGQVLAPLGMSEDDFLDKAKAAYSQIYPEGNFSLVGLRNAGDGTYYATQGGAPMLDKQGHLIVLDLNQSSVAIQFDAKTGAPTRARQR